MLPYDGKIIKNKQNVRQENIFNLFFYVRGKYLDHKSVKEWERKSHKKINLRFLGKSTCLRCVSASLNHSVICVSVLFKRYILVFLCILLHDILFLSFAIFVNEGKGHFWTIWCMDYYIGKASQEARWYVLL